MQICQLTAIEAERIERFGFVPDCHLHEHLSKRDAQQLVAAGNAKFISQRAIAAAGTASLSERWYKNMVNKENDRYLGVARSGPVRTRQIVAFMPRGMKHRTRKIGACGGRTRHMAAAAVNATPAGDDLCLKK